MTEKRADLPEQRQQRIAMRVREAGSVTVAGLEKELGISAATARRDLALLERQGKVKRTHGGAVPPGLTQHEDSFQQRLGEAVEQKKRLARAAAALLEADETVIIDSSTTAYYAARPGRHVGYHVPDQPVTCDGPLLHRRSLRDQHGGAWGDLPCAHPLFRGTVHDTHDRVLPGRQDLLERQGDYSRGISYRHQPA